MVSHFDVKQSCSDFGNESNCPGSNSTEIGYSRALDPLLGSSSPTRRP